MELLCQLSYIGQPTLRFTSELRPGKHILKKLLALPKLKCNLSVGGSYIGNIANS